MNTVSLLKLNIMSYCLSYKMLKLTYILFVGYHPWGEHNPESHGGAVPQQARRLHRGQELYPQVFVLPQGGPYGRATDGVRRVPKSAGEPHPAEERAGPAGAGPGTAAAATTSTDIFLSTSTLQRNIGQLKSMPPSHKYSKQIKL